MKKNDYPIDIVITWVDGSDPEWLKEKSKYLTKENDNRFSGGSNRYEDQGFLRYWFRGIEQNMPWVNKIFFVTYGHYPKWLNLDNPKLVLIKHTDFIPKEYLPTFNSNTILLNIHRIPGLSEHFILFNDDMYVLKPCKKELFFKKGLPCDLPVLNPVVAPDTDPFWDMMLNDVMVINKNFNKKKSIKENFRKWYSPKLGIKNIVRNLCFVPYNYFPGFFEVHIPNSYLKSTFNDVWDKNFDICNLSCLNKFRSQNDITEWTMKFWQLAHGSFYVLAKNKIGIYVSFNDSSCNIIFKKPFPYRVVCLNDEPKNKNDFTIYFGTKFFTNSSYEKIYLD